MILLVLSDRIRTQGVGAGLGVKLVLLSARLEVIHTIQLLDHLVQGADLLGSVEEGDG
jgi:hypothetical protein